MFNIGGGELLVVLLIAFIVVGPKDMPKIARWAGKCVRKIRSVFSEIKSEIDLGIDETDKER